MHEALHKVKAMATSSKKEVATLSSSRKEVKQDLLMRLFESEWFTPHMCLQYLYQNPQPGVEDYLCNKLYNMPESSVELYLLQFVYLAVSRPGSPLERTIISLCSKSFVIALKVHWLLLALCQDSSKPKHVDQLKDRCERAALEGQWELPFRVTRLDPLSPQGTLSPEASGMLSPVLSPLTQAPINLIMGSSPANSVSLSHHAPNPMLTTPGILTQIDESAEHPHTSPPGPGPPAQDAASAPAQAAPMAITPCQQPATPPRSRLHPVHTAAHTSRLAHSNTNGSSGSGAGHPSSAVSVPLHDHIQRIRAELGEGEGVTALLHRSTGGAVAVTEDDLVLSDDDVAGGLSPMPVPTSPTTRLRHDTYGATLEFMDTLCEASSSLASISQEERQSALRHTLEAINRELERSVRRDIAVWFPMGRRNERVVRIPAREAVLLNSREKAPFLLFVEVLVSEDGGTTASNSVHSSQHLSPQVLSAAGSSQLLLQSSQPAQTLGHHNLPILPGASLTSIKGTLTSMSPYLASLVNAPGPQPPLPPAAPAAAPQPVPAMQPKVSPVMVEGADSDSPIAVTASLGTGTSQLPSSASSASLPCSPDTQTPPITATLAAAGSTAAEHTTQPPSQQQAGTASVPLPASHEEAATSQSAAAGGALAAVLESLERVFGSREPPPTEAPAPVASHPASAPSLASALPPDSPGSTTLIRQSSAHSYLSAADVAHNSSSGSLAVTPSGSSVVIPHRRRQTSDLDQLLASTQLGASSTSGAFSVAPLLLGASSQTGITCAAEVAASESSPTLPVLQLSPYSSQSTPRLTTSDSGVAASRVAVGNSIATIIKAASISSPRPTQPQQPEVGATEQEPQPAVQPSEPSVWASALSTLSRVLLPSSSSVPSPTASSTAQATTPGGQVPLPALEPGASARPQGLALSAQDVQDLIQVGALPVPAPVPGPASHKDPKVSLSSKIAGAMASLRGEAPLVRLQLRVLPAAHAAEAAAAAAQGRQVGGLGLPPRSGSTNGGSSVASGGGADSDVSGSSPSSLLSSGPSKALQLLSKIGLCTRPTLGEDDLDVSPSASRRGPSSGIFSGGSRTDAPPPKLVAVSLEVAGGVNLSIASPYRKSRRTPSHEAISMVATQLKIYEMPPPLELGPPLTVPEGSQGSTPLGGDSWDDESPGSTSLPLPSRRSTPQLPEDYEQQVTTSMASFTSMALSAGLTPPQPAATTGGVSAGSLLGAVRLSAGLASSGSGNNTPLTSAGSTGLSFPQAAAQVSDLASPRLLVSPPSPKPGPTVLSPSAPSAAPQNTCKVGGLPMVGSVVSAAAAAAPGVLSPGPSGPLSDPPTPTSQLAEAHPHQQPNILNLAASTSTIPPTPSAASVSSTAPDPARSHVPSAASSMMQDDSHAPAAPAHSASRPATDTDAASKATSISQRPVSRSKAAGANLPRLHVPNSFTDDALPPIPPPLATKLDAATEKRRREAWGVYGERWAAKVRRIQRESPHGRRKGWALRCVIVKSGDDCRQELLAVQLIRTFAEIFSEAALPLWVRHYDVLVTSNKTAMIEVVPDALSIHTVKHRSPPGSSLSDHFFAKWPKGTPECLVAQRKFTESLAAYSIICYLMQIKDRHNGNVLLDDEGHLVHIDFGFMLSNSPGGVNFEAAPFKLTRELLEVMDSNSEGKPSELFDYFKVLMIQGFLACRKHHDRLLLLVKMMAKSGLPCYKTGERAVKALEKRLSLQLTEVQAMQAVLGLISDSLDAWRTRQYDYYQRLLNGIL